MTEEQSVVAEITCVEVSKKLDISYLNKLAIKSLWCCPAEHLINDCVFWYALELFVPPDPTITIVLLLMVKVNRAFELKPVRSLNIFDSCTV
jgi:hypothetical protein